MTISCCGIIYNMMIKRHLQLFSSKIKWKKLCLQINIRSFRICITGWDFRFFVVVFYRPTTVQSCETSQNNTGNETAPVGRGAVLTRIWRCSILSAQSSKPQRRGGRAPGLQAQLGQRTIQTKAKANTYPVWLQRSPSAARFVPWCHGGWRDERAGELIPARRKVFVKHLQFISWTQLVKMPWEGTDPEDLSGDVGDPVLLQRVAFGVLHQIRDGTGAAELHHQLEETTGDAEKSGRLHTHTHHVQEVLHAASYHQ